MKQTKIPQLYGNEQRANIISIVSFTCLIIITFCTLYYSIEYYNNIEYHDTLTDITQLQIRCDKLEKAIKIEQSNSTYDKACNTVEHRLMNMKITQLEKQINNINNKNCVSYEMILALLPELENISIKIEPVFVGPLFTIENKILPSPPKPILPPSLNYCEPRLIGKLLRR